MRVFSLVMLILGGFIGAGFASGREIASYFSRFQNLSLFSILIAVILLFVLVLLFLILSDRFQDFTEFINEYFGKLGSFINLLFAMSLLIIIGSMFAGSGVVAESFNMDKNFIVFLTAIFAFITSLGNIKSIDKINKILVPVMILIIAVVCGGNFVKINSSSNTIISSIFNGVNYIFINIVTLGLFVLEIGKNYTKKEKIIASLLVSLIIGIILFIFNNAIISNNLICDMMPIITLSNNKGNFIKFLTIISIWLALFTTLVSNVFVLSSYTSKFIKNKYINLIVILFAGMLLSFCGFDIIVNYVYCFIGVVGIIEILQILIKKKRRNFNSSLE